MTVRCYGCMQLTGDGPFCEHCGYDTRTQNKPHQLPAGTLLRGQYRVGRALGQGGFGVTYLGFDENLEIPIAIKEYFPTGMVTRDTTVTAGITVIDNSSVFQGNLDRFLKEAKVLAQLSQNPGVVRVLNFFPENGTAYIVMEYLKGKDLRDYLLSLGRPLTPEETFRLMRPVMTALQQVHEVGLIHRDISPDNIMLLDNGTTKLLDFGTAKDVHVEGEIQRSTEAILKHGFAPMEQYQRRGNLGPWTDVHALCASMYYCMTGTVPTDATERAMEGIEVDFSRIPGLTPRQAAALNKGMALRIQDRYASIKDLMADLFSPAPAVPPQPAPVSRTVPAVQTAAAPAPVPVSAGPAYLQPPVPSESLQAPPRKAVSPKALRIAVIAAAVFAIFLGLFFGIPAYQYSQACKDLEQGRYSKAYLAFEKLGDYRDSATMRRETRYQEAVSFASRGSYKNAVNLFYVLDGYRDSEGRMEACMDAWLDEILTSKDSSQVAVFEDYAPLGSEYYPTIYSKLLDCISSHPTYDYWACADPYADNPVSEAGSTVYELFRLLPSTYEDTAFLTQLFEAVADGEIATYAYVRDHSSQLKSAWHYSFVQDLLQDDILVGAFLIGKWQTADGKYYIHFYEDEEGLLYCEYTLPYYAPPESEYWMIRDMVFQFADKDSKALCDVYSFTMQSYRSMQVYCHTDKQTYHLTR